MRKNGIWDVATAARKGRVVGRSVAGVSVNWLITNSNDEIQSRQLADGFYELRELENLLHDVGPRHSVLDVGANIGNHAVFFLKKMAALQLIAIEPYPPAYQHLLVNLGLNASPKLDIRAVGAALSGQDGRGSIVPPKMFNIGLTKVDASAGGDVEIVKGDSLVGTKSIDFVKIDVEGMELDVLAGLESTLRRCRPAIYVEVSEATKSAVLRFATALGYAVVRDTTAYKSQSNLTLLPG